jgi:hypothetical protein
MRKNSNYIVTRIDAIQKELEMLKKFLQEHKGEKIVKIEGLWKGIEITEEDIEAAKRSLFKQAYNFEE